MADLAAVRYIADGFKEDAEDLLEDFKELQTFKFEEFAGLWKLHKFSLVYMGRETERELLEFTEECFVNVLNYLQPVSSIHVKVGALYLLYSLYIKQPLESKFKIRIQFHQWEELKQLYNFGKEVGEAVICFIIQKLLALKAFHFVAFPRLMGPRSTMTWELLSTRTGSVRGLKNVLREVLDQGDFEKLNFLHDEYQRAKVKVTETFGNRLNSMLENRYESIISDFQNLVKTNDFENLFGESSNVDDIGVRRALLKARQFQASCDFHVNRRRDELLSAGEDGESLASFLNIDGGGIRFFKKKKKKKRVVRKKRKPPKGERKKGRPRKQLEEQIQEEEEEEELEGEEEEYEEELIDPFRPRRMRKRAEIGKRLKFHFEDSELVREKPCDGEEQQVVQMEEN